MTEKSLPKLNTRAVLFVPICEGNHIAAAILEWIYIYSDLCERTIGVVEPFEVYVESAMGNLCNPGPFAGLGYEVDVDGNLETDLDNLHSLVSAQLSQPYDISDSEILEAINFLNMSGLARIYDHSFCIDTKIEKLFNIPQLYSSFDKACLEWFTSKPPTEITNDELLKAVPSIQQYLEKCKETWLRKREESNRK
jgi:hypothetical protein